VYFARHLFALVLLNLFLHSLVSSNDVRRLLLLQHYAVIICGQLFAGFTPLLDETVLSPAVSYLFLRAEARPWGTILAVNQESPMPGTSERSISGFRHSLAIKQGLGEVGSWGNR